jgi:hypothetical protein
MDVPPLFCACIYFCMGSGDPLHTPRALDTAGHLAGTSPHQWRGQVALPFRRFPHQWVRSRLLFLVGLLLSPSPSRNRVLSQAQGEVSLRSSVLYFLAGRLVALPAPALAQATPALCVSFVKPVLCTVDDKALRLGREDTPAHQNGSPLRREGYISRLTKCTASSRTTARSQSSATSLLAR